MEDKLHLVHFGIPLKDIRESIYDYEHIEDESLSTELRPSPVAVLVLAITYHL
jgi:hypothetical protein